jgi:hypothetical protein
VSRSGVMGPLAIREAPGSEFLTVCRCAQGRPAINFGVKLRQFLKDDERPITVAEFDKHPLTVSPPTLTLALALALALALTTVFDS